MNYTIVEDTAALPSGLLNVAKQHMRVDFDEDDDDIVRYLTWAIAYRQHVSGQQWFSGTVTWMPDDACARYQCPVQPVSDFTVMSDIDDVTDNYRLEQGSLVAPVWLVRADGTAFHSGAVVTLAVGVTALPPAEEGNVLRLAATLYEHRETVTTFSVDQMPMWLSDALGGLWIPRA
jgi:hypothetical protein